jgi:flagellar assembly protein FliH
MRPYLQLTRPLQDVTLARPVPTPDPAQLAALRQQAYAEGEAHARELADQQLVELRHEFRELHDGLLRQLADLEPRLTRELQTALPGLALELARRLLAGYEPPPEAIERHCRETLAAVFPERENLQLRLAPRDADLLAKHQPAWTHDYPGLDIVTDPALHPGDCQIRSRFGTTDARLAAKLTTLTHELATA